MHREGADQSHRDGDDRDDGRAPGLQEDQDDDGHQDDGFEHGVLHRLDRGGDEFRRVVGDGGGHARGQLGLDGLDLGQDLVGGGQGVGAGLLDDGDADAALAVEVAVDAIALGAQFDAGDVADAGHAAVGVGLDDHVGELVGIGQTTLDLHWQLEGGGAGGEGRLADGAGCGLDVLGAQGGDDVRAGQTALGGLGRIDPDPHRIVAAAEDLNLAHAVDPQEAVAQRRVGVVADVVVIQAAVGRGQADDHQEAAFGLVDRHADLADLLGQLGLGQGDAVLDQHLGGIEIRAGLEGHRDRHGPVRGGRGGQVQHLLDAVDLLLDGGRHGLGQGLGRGAGVGGVDGDRRGRDLRVLRQGQHRIGEQADQGDEHRDHAREDRAVDEEAGDIHLS
ncbi:hypothetical protein D3C86_1100920 [compost metagenome]